jgi:hypothetical protein
MSGDACLQRFEEEVMRTFSRMVIVICVATLLCASAIMAQDAVQQLAGQPVSTPPKRSISDFLTPDGRFDLEAARDLSSSQRALLEFVFAAAPSPISDHAGISATHAPVRPLDGDLLISDTCYTWDGVQWAGSSRTTYTYEINQLLSMIVEEEWDGGPWVYVSKDLFTYDGNNRMVNSTYQEWQGGQWVNVYDYAITYDGSGNFIEMLMREWENGAWVNFARVTLTYSGTLIQTMLDQLWADSVWENLIQVTYAYDGNNRVIEQVTEYWSGTLWMNSSRTTYAYDGSGLTSKVIQYFWTNVTWLQNSMSEYAYDGSGNQILAVASSWQDSDSSWVETEADTSKYIDDKLVEEVRNHIQTAEMDRTQYTWDGDNMVADLDQVWQDGAWVNVWRCVYVYGEICDCGIEGDMNCDGLVQPIDVTLLINYVYRDRNDICNAPNCPFVTGDLNCDGIIQPIDVIYIINLVYRDRNDICDGCNP